MIEMRELSMNSVPSWLEHVWDGINRIEPNAMTEEEHDDLMTAMHWVQEALGYEYNSEGEIVHRV